MIKISPSIMCADFSYLAKEINELEQAGADLLHFDICDGHFVPIITMGPLVISSIRKITRLPIEAHLQISEPEKQIDYFIDAGADLIIIHIETCNAIFRTIGKIKAKGLKVGISLNPITPVSYLENIISEIDVVLIMTVDAGLVGQPFIYHSLNKIKQVREMIDSRNLKVEIEVDGCINYNTIPKVVKAGADILVLGTSGLFGIKGNRKSIFKEVRKIAR